MKLIVAGSRKFRKYLNPDNKKWQQEQLKRIIKQEIDLLNVSHLILGMCPTGADKAGFDVAKEKDIPYTPYEPDWNKLGRAAGPVRNELMAYAGDMLLLLWDGKSKGSLNMLNNMLELKKPVIKIKVSRNFEPVSRVIHYEHKIKDYWFNISLRNSSTKTHSSKND